MFQTCALYTRGSTRFTGVLPRTGRVPVHTSLLYYIYSWFSVGIIWRWWHHWIRSAKVFSEIRKLFWILRIYPFSIVANRLGPILTVVGNKKKWNNSLFPVVLCTGFHMEQNCSPKGNYMSKLIDVLLILNDKVKEKGKYIFVIIYQILFVATWDVSTQVWQTR